MKLQIKCECGNCMEVSPETIGNVAYFTREALQHDFSVDGESYDINLLQDEVTDPDDVEVDIKEIRIACRKCGNYMLLDF